MFWKYSLKRCYAVTGLYLSLSALFAHHSACMPMAAPSPTKYLNVLVPNGSRLRGNNQQYLCTPSTWQDVATFLLANYVAHAVTVKSLPGESTLSFLRNIVSSLFFPVMGVKRGLRAIYQCAILAKTPLEAAAKAGALCMVVRTVEWKPEHGDVVVISDIREPQKKPWWVEDCGSGNRAKRVVVGVNLQLAKLNRFFVQLLSMVLDRKFMEDEDTSEVPKYMVQQNILQKHYPSPDWDFQPSSSSWDPRSRAIHGVCQLPSGYALCTVPSGSLVVELDKDQQGGED